ncbi:ABC transporter [Pseudomonas soli]|nr:ABC transporter [Pseudomonas soli]
MAKLSKDSFRSLMMWRVWMFLGGQDIKSRFRRSFFGPLWMVMTTGFFVGGVGVVYGVLFGQNMREFLPYLACGFSLWVFLVASFVEGSTAYVRAEGYIKQFSYPKQIYLLRSLVSMAIALMIGLLVVMPVQLFFHTFQAMGWLLAIPGILLLFLAALGNIAISAYIGVRFRDFPHAVGVLLQMLFFVTPIMFPAAVLQSKGLDFVYQFNPLFYLLDVVRTPILTGELASAHSYGYVAAYIIISWFVAFMTALRFDSRVVFLL